MPFNRPTGDAIPPGSVGPRKVPSNPATKTAVPPIQVRRWVRNGTHPNASLESKKDESLNHAGMFRTKDYFTCVGHRIVTSPISDVDDFWRFAFRTGPFAHAMYVSVLMHSPHSGSWAENSSALLNLYTVPDESVVAQSASFNFGPGPTSGFTGAWAWKRLRAFDQMIPVTPNTDYYALLQRINGAAIYSITAFELSSLTENNAGYLAQNIAAQQPIVDAYRENQNTLFKQLWEGTDPKTFHWTLNRGGSGFSNGWATAPDFSWKSVTEDTGHNILDYDPHGSSTLGSTSVSSSTPGWHPDMRYKNRPAAQPDGVPCVMKAFGYWDKGSNPGSTGGVVELKDSSGSVIASVTGWGATPEWQSTTFDLPAIHDKVDVHFRNGGSGSEFFLWAVSVYPVG